jgi:hypothetical protein
MAWYYHNSYLTLQKITAFIMRYQEYILETPVAEGASPRFLTCVYLYPYFEVCVTAKVRQAVSNTLSRCCTTDFAETGRYLFAHKLVITKGSAPTRKYGPLNSFLVVASKGSARRNMVKERTAT